MQLALAITLRLVRRVKNALNCPWTRVNVNPLSFLLFMFKLSVKILLVMKKLFNSVLFILLCNCAPSLAQTYTIALQSKVGANPMVNQNIPTLTVRDVSIYKGIPQKKYALQNVRRWVFNYNQNLYEALVEGRITRENYLNKIKNSLIDTACVTNQKINRNYVSVFIGLDSLSNKEVIVDANNNLDFSDDKVFTFNLKEKVNTLPRIEVSVDYFNGKEIQPTTVSMKMDPNETTYSQNEIERKANLVLIMDPYRSGTGIIGGKKYNFYVNNEYFGLYPLKNYYISVKPENEDANENSFRFNSTDTLRFGHALYRVKQLKQDLLQIELIAKTKFEATLNSMAPEISGKDIFSSKDFSSQQLKGKYILIDFWGSWCRPCVESLPDLKNLHEKYKSKNIAFVSIARESDPKLLRAKKIITEQKLDWPQLAALSDDLEKNYMIQGFPTTMLIDPKGKVVIKEIGPQALEKIASYLAENL
ncbi:TlpA family protein disulfide reductase [Solitalea lacus]|uniref:TlpA family protein disulfide reductase n=1 Tax=Solitalea lacus TaxID=2911172 RepID=UPI001EDAD952|nr:TlpA disulfide reductase family protein [Solitalea lacus]UKJ06930.1 TlpA family protein disulfide reductase [Solitalea lacus]